MQKQHDSGSHVPPLLNAAVVEPDDAIDEWVNEDAPVNNVPSADAPTPPNKRKSKSTSVSFHSLDYIGP
jgi:hypothetical protein